MVEIAVGGAEREEVTGGVAETVKSGPGWLGRIIVTATLTGTLTCYDNTAASGTKLFEVAAPTIGTIYDLGVPFNVGLHVVPGTAGTLIVVYT